MQIIFLTAQVENRAAANYAVLFRASGGREYVQQFKLKRVLIMD